ncbi:phosphotransferase [Paenibacillus sp. MMS20-IR301]|uniref:phosphotransferase enzyme family protein n=1 Tax=Paenibacillus sp. MMS20-IR301 TaxID=2895946 RepID=UPI0028E4D39D|nr:phosphotransferase [Paenibacillus sp. MMS20-IR301]WNS42357.1 phosphotransferase [Paenibacillus sp. MMS20-IR301]
MELDYLIRELNRSYPLRIEHIKLHREMIGSVYFAEGGGNRYMLKIYRSFKTADALQSVRILEYLQANSYPAASVLRTVRGESHLLLDHHGEWCPAVLYNYIGGDTPDGVAEAARIGQQTGELHKLMQRYPDQLIQRPRTEYIDDYLSIMRELDSDPGQILDLEHYGHELWGRISPLPRHFCHGDLHTGNMIRNRRGEYVLFDFHELAGALSEEAHEPYPLI